jgi:hypothetical protein
MPSASLPDASHPVGRYEWERIIRRAVMPKAVKYVALILATYADADGSRVRPGIDVLAAVAGEGQSTVRKRVAELRTTYGLLDVVSRGGGRNGSGKAAEYRLVMPVDLLERVEMLPPGDVAKRAPIHAVPDVSPLAQGSAQSEDSPLTQASGQSAPSPVDNSESPLTLASAQSPAAPTNDRSNTTTSDRLSAQNPRLSARLGELLPATTPTTTDQHPGPDPTQPTTARTDDEKPIDPIPAKCPHGLRPRHRADSQPSCAACRRALPGRPPP